MIQRTHLLALVAFAGGTILTLGQSAHYPAGVEGLKGASLPPPGLYLRDYNYVYTAQDFPGGPPDFDLFAYVQAPRLIWISKFQVLGGYYGADVLVPLVYQDVSLQTPAGPLSDSQFGLGDIFFEPITLSWHKPQFDLGFGYGFWAPTGDYDAAEPASPGKGYWGHMLTAGATLYLDAARSWSVSALNRYEIHQENSDTDITPGDVWTMEYGVGKSLSPTLDLGVIGYYVVQTTRDRGAGAVSPDKDQVFGVGPEINAFCPKLKLFTSLRYIYEIDARNRPEGHTINLTLTKIF